MKICPFEAKSLHAEGQRDGQTNKYDEGNGSFLQFFKSAKLSYKEEEYSEFKFFIFLRSCTVLRQSVIW
jgi:hypothetical protein